MINDLDETIKRLLITGVPLDTSEIDIVFKAPSREWGQSLARPSVNCYMYHMQENLELRQADWETQHAGSSSQNGSMRHGAARRRLPYRIDVHYMVTAWANEVEDEHRLQWRILAALIRYNNSALPYELLKGALAELEWPVRVKVAQPERIFKNPSDFWGSMEVEIRPTIDIVFTLPLDPELVEEIPIVLTKRIKVNEGGGSSGSIVKGDGEGLRELPNAQIGGWLTRESEGKTSPVQGADILLVERGIATRTDSEGRFKFDRVPHGRYTLQAVSEQGNAKRQVDVPGEEYNLAVDPEANTQASSHAVEDSPGARKRGRSHGR